MPAGDVVYWKPGTDSSVAFDPAADLPRGLTPLEYQSCLTSTCDRIVRAFLRGGVEEADRVTPGVAGALFETEDLQGAVQSFLTEGPGKATFKGR